MDSITHDDDGPNRSRVGAQLAKGSAWMVGMRMCIRGIGLVSTIILARLLTPADFGLVAMAMLVIAFIEVFTETGQQAALIRHAKLERAHYDSAWTMTVMINTALTGIIFAVAPLAGLYFHDERVVPVIQLLSLRVFIGGFLNIGTIDFRRNLDFAREFKFGLGRKIATFLTTLTLALIWKNYWALVVGVVVGHVMEMALSYAMHSYRPRFNLSKVKEIWSYSIWILVQSLGRFFENRIDEVAVGHVAPPAAMGRYVVSAELGALPMTELLEPVGRALFPNYARIAANPVLLRDVYLRVLAVAATICLSFGAGLALVAQDVVEVLLGHQWLDAAPLMVWFAAAGAITGINNTVFSVFNACGESRISATQTWLRVAFYVPAVLWAASTGVLMNFAIARLGVSALLSPTFFIRLRRVIPVTWGQLAGAVWRPFCASAIMVAAMVSIDFHALAANVFLRLPLEAAVGGAVFATVQLSLWLLAGTPTGAESALIGLLKNRWGKPGAPRRQVTI